MEIATTDNPRIPLPRSNVGPISRLARLEKRCSAKCDMGTAAKQNSKVEPCKELMAICPKSDAAQKAPSAEAKECK